VLDNDVRAPGARRAPHCIQTVGMAGAEAAVQSSLCAGELQHRAGGAQEISRNRRRSVLPARRPRWAWRTALRFPAPRRLADRRQACSWRRCRGLQGRRPRRRAAASQRHPPPRPTADSGSENFCLHWPHLAALAARPGRNGQGRAAPMGSERPWAAIRNLSTPSSLPCRTCPACDMIRPFLLRCPW